MPKKNEVSSFLTKDYVQTLSELTKKIQEAQLGASIAASKELVWLYWTIGEKVHKKQENSNWGEGFIETLARDLRNAFPGSRGFSTRNILRMRAFYRTYAIWPQVWRKWKISLFSVFHGVIMQY